MRIDIVTLFPGMVTPVLAESMLGRAQARGLVDIRVVNLRDYAGSRHRVTDDYQFGGGGGMVLKPEPLFAAVEALRTPGARVVLMDPRGRTLTQKIAAELAALVVTDAVTRLLPGVLGSEGAAARESFADGLLEPPQYTRPEAYRGARVPAVLLSRDHARIARWRRVQAIWLTWRERPDLLAAARLTPDERKLVERFERGETPEQLDDPRTER